MNISAAATAVGVSPDTLRQWDERIPALDIPRDPGGRRRFEERHLALLQTVKRLSDQGRSLESIRVILEPPAPTVMANAPVEVHHDTRQDWLLAAMRAAHEAAATRDEALARARQEIAELRADVGALRGRVAEVVAENAHLSASLESVEDRMQRAELINAVRQVQPERPWWKLW